MRTSCRSLAIVASIALTMSLTPENALAGKNAHHLQQQRAKASAQQHLLQQRAKASAQQHLLQQRAKASAQQHLLQQRAKSSSQHLLQQQARSKSQQLLLQQQRNRPVSKGAANGRREAISFIQPVLPGAPGALGMQNAPVRKALPVAEPALPADPTAAPSQPILPDEPVLVR